MTKRILGAEVLHANDLASDVLGELEVDRHLAAARQRTVLADEDYVEDFFIVVVAHLHFKLLLLSSHL